MYLFDLTNDPYETTNLYDSTDATVVAAKAGLYSQFWQIMKQATDDYSNLLANQYEDYCEDKALEKWKVNDMTVTPYLPTTWDSYTTGKSHPSYCGVTN
jgi:hypothetical protein